MESEMVQQMSQPRWRHLTARGLETLVGGVLLIAGLLKAWEPLDFFRQISDYKIVTAPVPVRIVAWIAIALECGLGAALIAGYRRRIVVPLSAGLIVIFLAAVGWAWATGATADCGCFGSWVKRTPAEAFLEDLVLFGALVTSGLLLRMNVPGFAKVRTALVGLAVVTGLAVTGWSSQSARQSSDPVLRLRTQAASPFASVKITGPGIDLSNGAHLVALIDTGCYHCQQAVPLFNKLTASGAPPLLGLCMNSEADIKSFGNQYHPQFPIGNVARDDFMRLLERGGTPRTLLVNDGQVLRIWDGVAPDAAEVSKILQSSQVR